MRLADILARLPDERKERLESHPLIRPELESGFSLEEALSGFGWARRWIEAASPLDCRLLLRLARIYAGLPFGEDEAEARLRGEADWTGAEIRVALARMLRDGVLFAVRKAWGERLLYLPSDMAGVWQLALRASKTGTNYTKAPAPALPEADAEEEDFVRLPLSLELLGAWSDIGRKGFPLTAKGAPNKARAAKLSAAMRLKESDLAPSGAWTRADTGVPANVALALDLGLRLGWLVREPGRIAAAERAPGAWADLTIAAADAELLDLVTERYAGQEASLHWAATALRGMEPYEWFPAEEALRQWEDVSEEDESAKGALDRWARLLAAFGWMERRPGGEKAMLRWLIDPQAALWRDEPITAERRQPGDGAVYVQPDLEIIVPPEAGFGLRWELERIAERVSLDVVSTYRITRATCIQAGDAGYSASALKEWLASISGAPLPEPAARALDDWFGRIGKLSFADAKLLAAETRELADRIARDGPASAWLLDRLNDRVFAVKPEGVRELAERLSELGYPPSGDLRRASESAPSLIRDSGGAAKPPEAFAEAPAAPAPGGADSGWMRPGRLLSIYEPDGSIPEREELFPGVESIPSVWLQQPRSYHPSTRRELIERALAWRTGVRVRRGDRWMDFVPEALAPVDGGWKVAGRIRPPLPGEPARVEWSADSLEELMIELPDGAEGPRRTNH